MFDVFAPGWNGTLAISNATSATAAALLPDGASEIALTNTSETADVFIVVTPFDGATVPTGTAPTLTSGFPVLARTQVRIRVGKGRKVIRAIASAADGALIVNPGNGG
jgi:hypothetical protein